MPQDDSSPTPPPHPDTASPKGEGRAGATVHIQRVLRADVEEIEIQPAEAKALSSGPFAKAPRAQRYLAWRRSAFLVAAWAGVVTLVFELISFVEAVDASDQMEGGEILTLLSLLALGVKCVLVVLLFRAASGWTDARRTSRQVQWGWGIAMITPAILALVPIMPLVLPAESKQAMDALGAMSPSQIQQDPQAQQALLGLVFVEAMGLLVAVLVFVQALPALLALFPGALRGASVTKTLVPARGLPAVVAVALVPILGILLLVILSVYQQVLASWVGFLGVCALGTGLVLHARGMWVQTYPLEGAESRARLLRVRRQVLITMAVAAVLLFIPVVTRRLFGQSVIGFGDDGLISPLTLVGLGSWFVAMSTTYSVVAADVLLRLMHRVDVEVPKRMARGEHQVDATLVAALSEALDPPA